MRILLINSNRFKQPWPVIPIGLCAVARACETAGHMVKVLDLCFSKQVKQEIVNTIKDFSPDIVGVSIRNIDNGAGFNTTFFLDQVKREVMKPLKKAFNGPIIIGGPAVGISGKEMLEFFDLEYAIRGDGELALVEFITRIKNNEELHGSGGLIIRENGEVTQEDSPYLVSDLNSLPFIKPYDYIDISPYMKYDSPLQIQTKRGCALKCTYCTYNRIEGHRYRLKDPQRVADEIEDFVTHTGINHIEFTDSTFNVPLTHAKAVLRALIAKGLTLRLRTMGLNPGSVDEELVDLMAHSGFQDVELGADAGCNKMLESLGKNFTKEDLLNAAKLLHKKNIPIVWYLLVGAPGETAYTLKETFRTLKKAAHPWDLINIGVGIRVYNGTPISEKRQYFDLRYTDDNFLHPVPYIPENIDLNEVKILTKRFALENTNVFMYDEDENQGEIILKIAASVARSLGQPVWKGFVLLRKLQKFSGFNLIRSYIFESHVQRQQRTKPTPEPSIPEYAPSFTQTFQYKDSPLPIFKQPDLGTQNKESKKIPVEQQQKTSNIQDPDMKSTVSKE